MLILRNLASQTLIAGWEMKFAWTDFAGAIRRAIRPSIVPESLQPGECGCPAIIAGNRHLCWQPSSVHGLSQREMCCACQALEACWEAKQPKMASITDIQQTKIPECQTAQTEWRRGLMCEKCQEVQVSKKYWLKGRKVCHYCLFNWARSRKKKEKKYAKAV